jgi:hypothetical protein
MGKHNQSPVLSMDFMKAVMVRIDPALDESLKVIAKSQDKPLSRVYRAAFGEYAAKYNYPKASDGNAVIPDWVVDPALLAEIDRLSGEEQGELVAALQQTKLDRQQHQAVATRLAADRLSTELQR